MGWSHRRGNALRFEQLESRAMLAVTAVQDDITGDVVITGDELDNSIALFFDGSGLTVFGADNDPPTFTNVRNVTINTGDGFDFVEIFGDGTLPGGEIAHEISGNLTVDLGAGANDELNVYGIDVAGDVVINSTGKTSSDSAAYNFLGWYEDDFDNIIGGNLLMVGGASADLLMSVFGQIGGDLIAFTGAGNDTIDMSNTRVDNVFASLGAGNADQLIWTTPLDLDGVDIAGSMTVLESENISLSGFGASERLEINGGLNIVGTSQNDNVFIFFADISGLTLMATAGGADQVTIQESQLDIALLVGGSGVDDLNLINTSALLILENFET